MISEINSDPLKARKMDLSHLGSIRHMMTARVMWRAVAISEINSNRLKARMKEFGQLSSKRLFVTARMLLKAVVFNESTLCTLLVQT